MGITNETSSTPTTSTTITPSQSTPTQAAVTTTTKAVGTAAAVSSQVSRSEATDETDGGATDGGATTAEERTVDAKPAADSETTTSKGYVCCMVRSLHGVPICYPRFCTSFGMQIPWNCGHSIPFLDMPGRGSLAAVCREL